MKLLIANAFSLLCLLAAFYLLLNDKDGWGWFLFASLLGLHTFTPSKKENTNSETQCSIES